MHNPSKGHFAVKEKVPDCECLSGRRRSRLCFEGRRADEVDMKKMKWGIWISRDKISYFPGKLVFFSEYLNHCFFVFWSNKKRVWKIAEVETGLTFAQEP